MNFLRAGTQTAVAQCITTAAQFAIGIMTARKLGPYGVCVITE